MNKIKYNLLPKQKNCKSNINVNIALYSYASELYKELDSINIIKREKEVPQLGVIKVKKKLKKTRYDYIMLQLYLHQLIKNKLQNQLRLTYNNPIKDKEFGTDFLYKKEEGNPTVGDIIQLLTIVYNIGHFYNTFTSSRAIIMMALKNKSFLNMIISSSQDPRFKEAVNKMIQTKNYQRFHLLNSILILEQCDRSKQSVLLAIEIIYSYINEDSLSDDNKLKYAFSIFRNVRTVSYMAYDLQIANIPLIIDLCNEDAMVLLLKELLSEYNNNKASNYLVKSITKLLDDGVYNKSSDSICYYKISRTMVSSLSNDYDFANKNYYYKYFINKESILNKKYIHNYDYEKTNILKLTFKNDDRYLSEKLLSKLESIHNTRVGYYDRFSGEQTILVSIRKNCDSKEKIKAAFKTLQCIISIVKCCSDANVSDSRYLLSAKFFLYYLFSENPLVIKPTIDRKKCVICVRGKNRRIIEIQSLLKNSIGNKDAEHEIEFMLDNLKEDKKNDTSLCIPASIVVYKKEAIGRKLCEFDGLVIYPTRETRQILFLEAKNTLKKKETGKKCLKNKLEKLSIGFNSEDIRIINHDALFKYSL